MKKRIAILASGGGSTAEAFIRAVQAGRVNAIVALVITNNPEAAVLQRVAALNQEFGLTIETVVISGKTHPAAHGETIARGGQTIAEQQAIIDCINNHAIDLTLLLGYMKKVGPLVVHEIGWRRDYTSPYQAHLLNTHPGLLPATQGYSGIHVQEHTLSAGFHEAGQTLHVVSEDYDDGPTVQVNTVAIKPDDTASSLFERVQRVEKSSLPEDIEAFLQAQAVYEREK